MKQLGIDPYPSGSGADAKAADILEGFPRNEGRTVTVAGRIQTFRRHGGLSFAHVHDPSGTIQLMLQAEGLPDTSGPASLSYSDVLELVDLGDIVETRGTVIKTRRGETSVQAETFRILAKSLRPPPDKWHGITDDELATRKPYLMSMYDRDLRRRFELISDLLHGIRSYLHDKGFIESLTPVLQPLYGGGKAKPFRTIVEALGVEYYLAISHELYLKRLIVGGFDSVYTIGRYFRNEGIDRTHNPEFSMLETMTAYKNFTYNMDLTEGLYRYLAEEVVGRSVFDVGGHEVSLADEWGRVSMVDAVREHCEVDFGAIESLDEANAAMIKLGLDEQATIGHALHEAFEERVSGQLIQPTIVYGHPVEVSPLARRSPDDPRYVERFELFIGGTEQGDNWTELNDPVELLARMQREDDDDEERHPIDLDFVEAMEHGMPPTTGLGPGIERLAMLLTESERIGQVAFFPLLRPHLSEESTEIYGSDAHRPPAAP